MLLINEAKDGGLVFTLGECDEETASIVVELPTQNQPLYFGSGDARFADNRVDRVIATANSIIIHRETGEEQALPIHLSGKEEARIYQFGDNAHAWLWKKTKTGEVIIRPIKSGE